MPRFAESSRLPFRWQGFAREGRCFRCRPAAFLWLLLSVCYGPIASAQVTTFRWIEQPSEALRTRLQLIDAAEHRIDVAYYAIDSGAASASILDALVDASRRGVRVRVLMDGCKSRLPQTFLCWLSQQGLDVRVFHRPTLLEPRKMNRRFHGKWLIVDEQTLLVGSRNLEDAHFALDSEKCFVDSEAVIHGAVARCATRTMDRLWKSDHLSFGREGTGWRITQCDALDAGDDEEKAILRDGGCYGRQLDLARVKVERQIDNNLCERVTNGTVGSMQHVASGKFHWLVDDCLDKSRRSFQCDIIRIMDAAKSCLQIESPYPAMSPEIRDAILRAARRGVAVTMVTNSGRSTDQRNVYAAYQNDKRELLAAGVGLHEYIGDGTLHAKLMVVDHSLAMLGTYNFDARSDTLNLENAVVSDDANWVSSAETSFRSRLRCSQSVEPKPWLPIPDATPHRWLSIQWRRAVVPFYRWAL